MKIDTTNPVGPAEQISTASKTRPAATRDDFAALLESEMPSASTEEASSQPQELTLGLEHLNAVSNSSFLFALENNASIEETAAATVEEALDGLEELGQLLEDQSASPRQVDTVFRNLSEAVPRLQEQMSQLPDGHPLRKIG